MQPLLDPPAISLWMKLSNCWARWMQLLSEGHLFAVFEARLCWFTTGPLIAAIFAFQWQRVWSWFCGRSFFFFVIAKVKQSQWPKTKWSFFFHSFISQSIAHLSSNRKCINTHNKLSCVKSFWHIVIFKWVFWAFLLHCTAVGFPITSELLSLSKYTLNLCNLLVNLCQLN